MLVRILYAKEKCYKKKHFRKMKGFIRRSVKVQGGCVEVLKNIRRTEIILRGLGKVVDMWNN